MDIAPAHLEYWLRDYYFTAEIDISCSGVESCGSSSTLHRTISIALFCVTAGRLVLRTCALPSVTVFATARRNA